MKKQAVPAILLLALAVLTAIGSQTFLSPCVHEDGTFGSCHWAGRALFGLGCVLGLLAVLALCVGRARFGVYLSVLPVCAAGVLTPGTLIALCRTDTMRCRAVMQPVMIILFSAALLCAAAGVVLTWRRKENRT